MSVDDLFGGDFMGDEEDGQVSVTHYEKRK